MCSIFGQIMCSLFCIYYEVLFLQYFGQFLQFLARTHQLLAPRFHSDFWWISSIILYVFQISPIPWNLHTISVNLLNVPVLRINENLYWRSKLDVSRSLIYHLRTIINNVHIMYLSIYHVKVICLYLDTRTSMRMKDDVEVLYKFYCKLGQGRRVSWAIHYEAERLLVMKSCPLI